tara:strand:+ start:951 stop:2909 length:1959 start_codon:yes stop_codon:yes gene_type:complete
MAEKRTINIDINNNADEAAKDFENFAKATNTANDSVEGLNKTFEEVYGEIQPLTTRMGEAEDRLYELAAAGDTTSKEYQQLLSKVGEYRKVQIQTDLAVDQAAGTMSEKLGGALAGAASAFSAVQGVMALTGGESEALEKSLLKVQGAMAFQQGIDGVLKYSKSIGLASKATALWGVITGTVTGGLKLLRIALISTGIGAIAVGVGLLIANFDKLIGVFQPVINGFKAIGDFIGITNFAEDELNEERAARAEEELRRIENERKQREQAFNQRQSEFDREISLNQALGKSTFKLTQEKIKASIEYQKEKVKEIQLELEAYEIIYQGRSTALTRAAGVQENISKLKETLIEANKSIADSETELKVNVINNNNEKSESFKKYSDEKKKNLEEIAKLEQEAIDNEIKEEIALQQTFDAIQRENEDRFRTEQENELLLVEEKYDTLQAMAFGNAEALEQIELAKLNELNDVKQKFADEEVAIETDKNKKIVQDEKATQEQKLQAVKDTFTTIANLAELFTGESEREQKKAFKIQKAANIANATIDTYLSAVSSYKSLSGIPVVGPVLGGAAAAAAVTAGLLNIKSIAKQEFGGGVGDTPAVPSNVEGGGAPQFNVVGDSGVNQLAQLQQQPTQAFVVSGEVTTAQALDRNRVQNATL